MNSTQELRHKKCSNKEKEVSISAWPAAPFLSAKAALCSSSMQEPKRRKTRTGKRSGAESIRNYKE
eukprot:1162051-Pelagomonas_calceolata.AAC.17